MHAMLPALALSRMRLQVPPGWSLKSLGRGSCLALPTSIGVPLGFPRGGQHGGTPASRSSTRRASPGSPQRGLLQKMPRDGLRGLGCASLSPYSQRDAQTRLPGGRRARPPLLPLVPSCCNIWGGCGAGDTSAKQRHRPLLLHRSGAGRRVLENNVLLLGCWLLPQPRAESSGKRQREKSQRAPAKISPGGSGVNMRQRPPAVRVWGTEQVGQAVPFET